MEVMERRCDECGRYPRRLSLEMEGHLFCQRDCYLAYSARKWDRMFTETFHTVKPRTHVLEIHKGIKTA